ncbi:LysM peptidoglycan-binding domain-containing protein [Cellulomonas xylanilytica]|uniref:LysM domain-containing protein n=1 Tax=Cellulomonas xylanilytica TaxID=233583 RepID=A0A510V166_9CELL|nr:LysM peptidoglycan-binding domain-containing protein [Cellulomonas xylanilytica]GEK20647.1 hypothetical protein CXY01_11670 [Cellulomonas xylanilytica]
MSAMVVGPAVRSQVSVGRSSGRRTGGGPVVPARAVNPAPAATTGPATAHLHLTARGRAVLWILAAVVVAAVTLFASQASADAPVAAQEVVRHVVQPGETLWQIAESVSAPSQDVRDVVVELVALNELPDAGLMAGQVIVVPAD